MITVRVDGAVAERPEHPGELLTGRRGHLVWVDAVAPDEAELGWLARAFDLHPLEVHDIIGRNERPKVDEFEHHLFLVLIGASAVADRDRMELVEVHAVVAEEALLTVRDRPLPSIDAFCERAAARPQLAMGHAGLLFYRLADAVVDSYFPVLDDLDAEIDELETSIIERADSGTVTDIFRLKRDLNLLRRVLGPERDLMQALAGSHGPRLGDEAQLYLRDVYDHTLRMTEQVDAYRDIVTGALDVYLSSVSNRLSEQTRRLALVATIFLPLTFFTGFFGQNFGVLVNLISSAWTFYLALAVMAVSVVGIYLVSQHLSRSARPLPSETRRRGFSLELRRRRRAGPKVDLDIHPSRPHRRAHPAMLPPSDALTDSER